MSVEKWPVHYRYYDTIGPEGVTIECQRFIVIGETPMCYYVIKSGLQGYGAQFQKEHRKRGLKSDGGKKLCYQSKVSAMQSYRARKKWQISHAHISLERAKAALDHADVLLAQPELIGDHSHICEGGDYIRELSWDI